MKKKIVIFTGMFAMVAAGVMFFATQKSNSLHHAIYLDNMEALARSESGTTANVFDCYTSLEDAESGYANECESGTTVIEQNKILRAPFTQKECDPCDNKKHTSSSLWGFCFVLIN